MAARVAGRLAVTALALAFTAGGAGAEGEARVSLDARDAEITDIVRVLAEAGGFQVVFDPDIGCRLTLRLREVSWRSVLDASLAACSLGFEEEAGVLRVAPVARLREEAASRRKLEAERGAQKAGRVAAFRLSYGRAERMAPLLARMLPPPASVSYDARTNTLIVSY